VAAGVPPVESALNFVLGAVFVVGSIFEMFLTDRLLFLVTEPVTRCAYERELKNTHVVE
jgi:hypothetical protein